MLNKIVYEAAIKEFGKCSQIVVAIEECSELQKELTKTLREKGNLANLAEEIADVEIMLEQLKLIFKNREQVQSAKNFKIHRLEKLLHNMQQEQGE